ncbi:hypothetical protein GE09DRAFT_1190926 [Coniochaeta sp. 2T2.1]|nr:hypothetical protein GE09DRAFT_1190926 [Coniochaeta sp. 2T2.1]
MKFDRLLCTIPSVNPKWCTLTPELVVTRLGSVDEDSKADKEVNAVAEKVFAEHGLKLAEEEKKKDRLRLAWAFSGKGKGRYPSWMHRAERVHEFHGVELEDGRAVTDYCCWETSGGVLSRVVRWWVGAKMRKGCYVWGIMLRVMAERVEKEEAERVVRGAEMGSARA